jgi:DNA-binding transcriptional MocR family regulator
MGNGINTATVIDDLRSEAAAAGPGGRLPSVRELMARHRAGPNTVQRALAQLEAEGVLVARPGHGTFAADRPPAEPAPPDLDWQAVALGGAHTPSVALAELLSPPGPGVIPLSYGYLEEGLQPQSLLRAAMARAARRPDVWQRPPTEGVPALRAWFARATGAPLGAHDLIVTDGGQPALAACFGALAAPGSPVLVESPTYLGALAVARAAGLHPVPVPADGAGVRPDLLAEALRATGARLFYCQPTFANPHGASLAPERRAAVLQAVQDAGAFLIEDDWARDFALEPAAPPLVTDDRDGHVVYVRSLSKSAAPGLRVGAIAARGPAAARLRARRLVDALFVAAPMQQFALEAVSAPGWPRHLRTLRAALRTRRDALLAALADHVPALRLPAAPPPGGLHVWTRLPDGADAVEVARAALREGVLVSPGDPWFADEPPAPHLRLTFAGAPPEALLEGARRLGRALRG